MRATPPWDFLARGGVARVLVGDYLDVTDPIALRRFVDLEGSLTFRVFQSESARGFHLKSYTFLSGEEGVSFVGSSNISEPALTTSIEWNYKVISSHDVTGFGQIRQAFGELFELHATRAVTSDWIDAYERRRVIDLQLAPNAQGAGVEYEAPLPKPEPHAIQQRALTALEQTREDGFSAGLVVLATGLGKTWLAAFDSDRPEFGASSLSPIVRRFCLRPLRLFGTFDLQPGSVGLRARSERRMLTSFSHRSKRSGGEITSPNLHRTNSITSSSTNSTMPLPRPTASH